MSGVLRGIIVTLALVFAALAALFSWGYFLQQSGISLPEGDLYPYEQLLFIAISAPVLASIGAFTFWLYEPAYRVWWSLVVSTTISVIITWLAPSAIFSTKPLVLWLYRISVFTLSMLLILFGSFLAGKIMLVLARKRRSSST